MKIDLVIWYRIQSEKFTLGISEHPFAFRPTVARTYPHRHPTTWGGGYGTRYYTYFVTPLFLSNLHQNSHPLAARLLVFTNFFDIHSTVQCRIEYI